MSLQRQINRESTRRPSKQRRATIPSEVKRRLRQESGFGCCQCGHPFIEFHHIVPWAEDQHFRPDDMMALCSNCHSLCTAGAITTIEQRRIKARPINIIDDILRGRLYVNTADLTVRLAGGVAINTPHLLTIGGERLLSVEMEEETGRVLVSAIVQDEARNTVGWIEKNEWLIRPSTIWDLEIKPRSAAIRHERGGISFAVDTNDDSVSIRGRWFVRSQRFTFSETKAEMSGFKFSNNVARDCESLFVFD